MNAKNGANQPLELGPPALSSFAIAVSSISIAQGDFSVLDWEKNSRPNSRLKRVSSALHLQFDGNSAGRANHVTRRVFIIIFLFNMRVPAVEVAPFSPFSL